MKRSLLAIALLALAGCGDLFFGGRTGTDPAGSASESSVNDSLFEATWSRLRRDTTIVLRIDTLDWSAVQTLELPLPESTTLALVSRDGSGGIWLGAGDTTGNPSAPGPLVLHWYDSLHREGWTFELPGTGTVIGLVPSDSWTSRTIPVFADKWLMRLAREVGGKRVVWNVDSTDLSEPLELDLSGLPDTACHIAPGAHGHLECAGR